MNTLLAKSSRWRGPASVITRLRATYFSTCGWRLAATPAATFMSDMKLRIADYRSYYYPEVMLVCDDSDQHSIYKTAPCFIAEVLSPSTANIDQREKWVHYLPGYSQLALLPAGGC
jgi:Uma2 family endonuclease